MSDAPPLLDIRGLTVALPAGADRRHAVEDLWLRVQAGRTLCLVGESGSGKSLAAAAIVRLMPSPQLRITGGQVLLDGRDTLSMDTAGLLDVVLPPHPAGSVRSLARVARTDALLGSLQETFPGLGERLADNLARETEEGISAAALLRPAASSACGGDGGAPPPGRAGARARRPSPPARPG